MERAMDQIKPKKNLIPAKYFILLRGLARSRRHWGPFLDELQKDSSHFVEALDLAGNGDQSERNSFLNISDYVEDLRYRSQWIKEQRKPWIVAVSLGGMVAIDWATRYPKELSGIIVINSSLGRFSAPWQRLRPQALRYLRDILFSQWQDRAFDRELNILRMVSNQTLDYKKKWALEFAKESSPSLANFLRQLGAASRYKGHLLPPELPTLLLASEKDRMVSVECSKKIAQFWHVPLKTHPWAGHELAFDDPAWVINNIKEWQ
jgi:pimeloyl-ACP methyl ester carboxylesterase